MKKLTQLKIAKEAEYYTVDEAAIFLNIKPTAIRNYLTDDKLTTYKFKTLTLIRANELVKWKKEKSRR